MANSTLTGLTPIPSGTIQSTDVAYVVRPGSPNLDYKATYANLISYLQGSLTLPSASLIGTINLATQVSGVLSQANGGLGDTNGNASTATALQTARTINGTPFDGTSNITITAVAGAGTLTGTTLASNVVNSSLTSVGTLANLTVTNPISGSVTGNAATVTTNANLTGPITSTGNTVSPLTAHAVLIGNGTGAIATVSPGTSGNVLTSNGTNWVAQAAAPGGVTSVTNSDGTLTISPTSGAVVAELALGHANTWTGQQTFVAPVLGTPASGVATNLTGTATALNIGGNAATATVLQTARTIAGQSFNGSANISIASANLSDASNIPLENASNTFTGTTNTYNGNMSFLNSHKISFYYNGGSGYGGGINANFGGGSPVLQFNTGTNENLSVQPHISLGDGIAFASVNDASTANLSMEFRASQYLFWQNPVTIQSTTYFGSYGDTYIDANGAIWDGVDNYLWALPQNGWLYAGGQTDTFGGILSMNTFNGQIFDGSGNNVWWWGNGSALNLGDQTGSTSNYGTINFYDGVDGYSIQGTTGIVGGGSYDMQLSSLNGNVFINAGNGTIQLLSGIEPVTTENNTLDDGSGNIGFSGSQIYNSNDFTISGSGGYSQINFGGDGLNLGADSNINISSDAGAVITTSYSDIDFTTGQGGGSGNINFAAGASGSGAHGQFGSSDFSFYDYDGSGIFTSGSDILIAPITGQTTRVLSNLVIAPNQITPQYSVPCKIFNQHSIQGVSTTTETTLNTFTVPANMFKNSGDQITAEYSGYSGTANTTNRIRFYFAGTLLFDSGTLVTAGVVPWIFKVTISPNNVGSGAQLNCKFELMYNNTLSTLCVNNNNGGSNYNLTASQIMKVTGQSTTTANLTINSGFGMFLPA